MIEKQFFPYAQPIQHSIAYLKNTPGTPKGKPEAMEKSRNKMDLRKSIEKLRDIFLKIFIVAFVIFSIIVLFCSCMSRQEKIDYYLAKGFSPSETNSILKGTVFVGMSKKAALESWGQPERKNVSISSTGRFEQWVYNQSYIYFLNDKITSIDTPY